ncbi:Glutamyl-Q tRNA(Asp) synthetase [Clarias magur]|uniref:Glutamyl-Q tRNA(Asp) synthetase n=1 Tax=Clarias magur TaxID=1594786 RepID=A0A8J4XE90_CLAMG|nr:Glutamyl-Q tRNA(Asp) synthetase [Clarias magur]
MTSFPATCPAWARARADRAAACDRRFYSAFCRSPSWHPGWRYQRVEKLFLRKTVDSPKPKSQ